MLNLKAIYNDKSVIIISHFFDADRKFPCFIAIEKESGKFVWGHITSFQLFANDPLLK